MTEKLDPYAALRFREFNIFLVIRFILVFGWSMQFIIVEWEVYSLTKDPLSLGLIGLVEVIPAISMALFAGHIVDQREKKRLFAYCVTAFFIVAATIVPESDLIINSITSIFYVMVTLIALMSLRSQ